MIFEVITTNPYSYESMPIHTVLNNFYLNENHINLNYERSQMI